MRRAVTMLCCLGWAITAGCSNEPSTPPAATAEVQTPASTPRQPPAVPRSSPAPVRRVYAESETTAPAPPPPPSQPLKSELTQGTVPKVALTVAHAALCRVAVGDPMPALELTDLDGQKRALASLYGANLTVVCFWKADRALARAELADLGHDIVTPFAERGVAVVGIAVEESAPRVEQLVRQHGIAFPTLLDADGSALGRMGSEKLPRTYLLDPAGTVVWFDIEYSRSTRRELAQAIRALLGDG